MILLIIYITVCVAMMSYAVWSLVTGRKITINIPKWLQLIILAHLLATSCNKTTLVDPQTVVYEVWCDNCFIFLEDDAVNRNNTEELKDYKNFNVSGYFRYEFENTRGLEKVFATILVSVYYPEDQLIRVKITDTKSGNTREETKDTAVSGIERISIEMEL